MTPAQAHHFKICVLAESHAITALNRIQMDDAELLVRGQMLGTVVAESELVETQKKDVMKGFRERLEELWLQRVRFSGIIKRKSESRLVNCAVEFHSPVAGTKRITRLDTGEFVRDEPMTAAEHQGNLFQMPAPTAKAEGSAPTEGFHEALFGEMAKGRRSRRAIGGPSRA